MSRSGGPLGNLQSAPIATLFGSNGGGRGLCGRYYLVATGHLTGVLASFKVLQVDRWGAVGTLWWRGFSGSQRCVMGHGYRHVCIVFHVDSSGCRW